MEYVLTSDDLERGRLEEQAKLLDPFTRSLLVQAGVVKGVRVLDVGCGAGDVSLLAAELVGSAGWVLGVDIEPTMVEHAQARTQAAGVTHASFRRTLPMLDDLDERFDVVVARLVTLFQPDPVAFVRRLAQLVRTSGTLVLVEPAWDFPSCWSRPPIPAYDELMRAFINGLRAFGVSPDVGGTMVRLFAEAGLPRPMLSAHISLSDADGDLLRFLFMNFAAVFIHARTRNLDGPSPEDLTRLAKQIRAEARALNTQFSGPLLTGAYVIVA